jgi:hypothetical protein
MMSNRPGGGREGRVRGIDVSVRKVAEKHVTRIRSFRRSPLNELEAMDMTRHQSCLNGPCYVIDEVICFRSFSRNSKIAVFNASGSTDNFRLARRSPAMNTKLVSVCISVKGAISYVRLDYEGRVKLSVPPCPGDATSLPGPCSGEK